MEFLGHKTVLLNELVDGVNENDVQFDKKYFIDLTLGGCGHTVRLLEVNDSCLVVGVDQDQDALDNANIFLTGRDVNERVTLVKSNFANIDKILKDSLEFTQGYELGGVIADIGVSSHQFDEKDRGFSFRFDGPLDMRMNYSDAGETAADVINDYDFESLVEIFKKYGEEKLAHRIAESVCEKRALEKITTTKQLENIIFHCYPKKWRHGRTHPATRVFQALRIFVNKELEVLEEVIPRVISILPPGARFGIITFHSLEDRIVKHMFRDFHQKKVVELVKRKPILPSEEEIKVNPRSRSAKLRMVTKL